MKIGLIELLKSAKGTLCLIVLAAATYGLKIGHADVGAWTAYGIIITTITNLFMWTRHKTDLAVINKQ